MVGPSSIGLAFAASVFVFAGCNSRKDAPILVQAIAFADASMSATLSSPVGSIEIIESKRLAAIHPNEVARESYRSHQVSSALAARILAAVGELSNPVSCPLEFVPPWLLATHGDQRTYVFDLDKEPHALTIRLDTCLGGAVADVDGLRRAMREAGVGD